MLRPFEQTGTFNSGPGTEGQENFPIPYATAANVTLSGYGVVVEATTTGFKWKNAGNTGGPATWTAKGIRATKLPK